MIAKHVPMTNVRKSSASELINYLKDPQSKQERVGAVTVTNCHQQEAQDAALEIEATQALNLRAEGDKTYHLIISFREGESPSDEALRAIEEDMCRALGYSDHQRVSAVHHDTDNLHIHVAINKIHPTKHTIHTPYNDFKTLGKTCERLEVKHGLERDNHTANRSVGEGKAADMERHSGVQSLLGWMKQECVEDLRAAKSWQELHAVSQQHGLQLKEQANGIVFQDSTGITVKASSVARDLSKQKLEGRLGDFEAVLRRPSRSPTPSQKTPVGKIGTKPPPMSKLRALESVRALKIDNGKRYQKSPLGDQTRDTSDLYQQFQMEQEQKGSQRKDNLALARRNRDAEVALIKHTASLQRAAIKRMTGMGIGKKFLYQAISRRMRTQLQEARERYGRKRDRAYSTFRRNTWADWLKVQADRGNKEALRALRTRDASKRKQKNHIHGKTLKDAPQTAGHDSVTKSGTLIYRFGASAVRDDGEKLSLSRGVDTEGIKAALTMAKERYEGGLTINGSDSFKEQVVKVSVAVRMDVRFNDPELDKKRQDYAKKLEEERSNVRDQNRRSTDRRGHESAGRPSGRREQSRRESHKPNVAKPGRTPPPQSTHRLRGLSELSVVRFSKGSEVLLPGNVPGDMEQQRRQSDNGLRRNVPGAGLTHQKPDLSPIDQYIKEREDKRSKGFDIPKHRRYAETTDAGPISYAGQRNINGQTLALFNKEGEVIVKSVDAATSRRLKRVNVGASVTMTTDGAVRTKGRSR